MAKQANIKDNGDIHNMQERMNKLQAYSTLVKRAQLAQAMGTTFGGSRDIEETLGYKKDVAYHDYWYAFKRQDIAKAIINRPVQATWQGPINIIEVDDDEETALEKEWKALTRKHWLKDKFIRVDRLTCIGRYGVLLLGLDDVKRKEDAMRPVETGKRRLEYIKPLSEASAEIISWDTKASSPRYGLPVMYQVTVNDPQQEGINITMRVHYTRIIHITGDRLESEVYGTPVLEAVYNRLEDLRKLVGGSAEMFWKGARPGYGAKLDPDFNMSADEEEELEKQIDEYEHSLRRILVLNGVEMQSLAQQVSDPTHHVDAQIQMISAVTGIPKRILTGSERGELSSTQDIGAWKELIQMRREEYAELQIIGPFVNRMIELQVLPEAIQGEYVVEWSDLHAPSEKEKAEVGKIRAAALKEYASQPTAEAVVPPVAFMKYFLGLTDDQISMLEEYQEQAMLDEEREMVEDARFTEEPKPDEPTE